MANAEQLALLRQGVSVWNEWRQQNEDIKPDLLGADLAHADLSEAGLSGANLFGANLSGAALRGSALSGAIVTKADLTKADLTLADLSGSTLLETDLRWANCTDATLVEANCTEADFAAADLTRADLSGADLNGAELDGANLSGADLGGAELNRVVLSDTVLGDTNLRNAQGLDACRHFGPSTIDHRTLTKSAPLPQRFLRGCGLPDQFIDYLSSLFNQAIQFYSCFISYSTKDQAFGDRRHADLQNNGVRCWLTSRDIRGGQKVHEQIDEAIRVYDRLLLILSPSSMHSPWVKVEIAHARRKELASGKKVLFPVALVPFDAVRQWEQFNADIGEDTAREVREYFIPDFSNWKNHNDYQSAFERLLQDLKADVIGR